jgi:hypothetical protein
MMETFDGRVEWRTTAWLWREIIHRKIAIVRIYEQLKIT